MKSTAQASSHCEPRKTINTNDAALVFSFYPHSTQVFVFSLSPTLNQSLSGHLLLGVFLGKQTFANLGVESFTGSHLASVEAVAASEADLAAIDCVTWHLIVSHRPHLADKVKVMGRTPFGLCLPYVLEAKASSEDIDQAQKALLEALTSNGMCTMC